jgi:hypothetical protein
MVIHYKIHILHDIHFVFVVRSQKTTPLAGNYRLVPATPTIQPADPGATPLMTWGSIEGTPAPLEEGQTPRGK